MWNERLDRLTDFPFRRLARLLEPLAPPSGTETLDLALGEPKHPPPALLAETVAANAHLWNRYPPVIGTAELRRAAVAWLSRRYDLPPTCLDPDRHVVTVSGTKEALYLLPQIVTPGRHDGAPPAILVPNPVYSTYVGAAVMAGAEPVYLPARAETGFLPDLDALSLALLDRAAAFYLCTPANPQGAMADMSYLRRLVRMAREHDFLLILDECYAELYYGEPPRGGLEAALAEGGAFDHVVVLHSLSKRSNAAGLRVGFVAGDPEVLARFARLRSYGGTTQPMPLQAAAAALYADEAHVTQNRELYRRKYDLAERRLGNRFGFYRPAGGFFLWLDVGDGEAAAARLWSEAGVRVLPGGYLAMGEDDGSNPGERYIRIAMVHEEALVDRALARLAEVLG